MSPPQLVSAQIETAFNSAGRALYPLPSNAVIGSTDERRNAFDALSEEEKKVAADDHEGGDCKHQGAPFNTHVRLGFSRSKHGTYAFNPNNFPLFPYWVIVASYSTIHYLYASGRISPIRYLILLFLADQAFFECVVDRFQEQGGFFAGTRTNVGELKRPLNNSGFINDPALRAKLGFRF